LLPCGTWRCPRAGFFVATVAADRYSRVREQGLLGGGINVLAMCRHVPVSTFGEATMLRKLVCAAVILGIGFGVAMADEFTAIINKVEGNKVTFQKAKFDPETKMFEKGPEMTLPVTADAKITKGKFNKDTKKTEAGEPLADGLKNDLFTKIGEKGRFASITTDAGNKNITAISTFGFKKKKDAN
jgi:hypothetical protein